jgi:hypothetical protein
METLNDFITGKPLPNVGAEENRQMVERHLVQQKDFDRQDVEVDVDIELSIDGQPYRSQIDLVVCIGAIRYMLIKCAAGSLGSREREALAAARLLETYQIPYAVVSDGKTATVLDTISGKKTAEGLEAIPSKKEAQQQLSTLNLLPLPEKRIQGEKLIFRTYDTMYVNVSRNVDVLADRKV